MPKSSEAKLAYMKQYRQDNKDKIKQWRIDNKEKIIETNKKYRDNNNFKL